MYLRCHLTYRNGSITSSCWNNDEHSYVISVPRLLSFFPSFASCQCLWSRNSDLIIPRRDLPLLFPSPQKSIFFKKKKITFPSTYCLNGKRFYPGELAFEWRAFLLILVTAVTSGEKVGSETRREEQRVTRRKPIPGGQDEPGQEPLPGSSPLPGGLSPSMCLHWLPHGAGCSLS